MRRKIRLLICGDRNWNDQDLIYTMLKGIKNQVEIVIEGEAPGADSKGKRAAIALGILVRGFPAAWNKFGRAAGPIRNQKMLDEGKPTELWAFHDHIESSRGTADMLRRARKAGIPTAVFSHHKGVLTRRK